MYYIACPKFCKIQLIVIIDLSNFRLLYYKLMKSYAELFSFYEYIDVPDHDVRSCNAWFTSEWCLDRNFWSVDALEEELRLLLLLPLPLFPFPLFVDEGNDESILAQLQDESSNPYVDK